jgi:hypothetical protein
MKSKTILVSLAVWIAAGAVCFGNEYEGTWKLNTKRSHLGSSMGRNNIVKYESIFLFREKVTIDGTDAHGKAIHNEWVGAFDGKEYPVTGDAESDTRAYNKIDDHNLTFMMQKGGKPVGSGKIVISADGKSRTVTSISRNRKGKAVHSIAIYDKI